MNKIVLGIVLVLLVGCSSQKTIVQTSKKAPTTTIIKPKKITPETQVVIDQEYKAKLEALDATSKIRVTADVVYAYVNQYKKTAKDNMINYGVPASITLAQGILESGAGTGKLCKTANNHFGIKCHKEWTGDYVRHDDDAAQECFRKYQYPSESFKDHSLFLTSRPWYAPLFNLPKNDYKAWARGLKKAGYATDPKYPDKLIGIIERYQLFQYDLEVLNNNDSTNTNATVVLTDTLPPANTTAASANLTHTVAQGDSLYSIAKKYQTTVETIKQNNNLVSAAISVGQILIIKL